MEPNKNNTLTKQFAIRSEIQITNAKLGNFFLYAIRHLLTLSTRANL